MWVRGIVFSFVFRVMCFFFFSSRRRHTRSLRDWSSDVCSSDLLIPRIIRVDDAGAVDGADRHALRVLVEADTLGALGRIDHEAGALLGNRIVGTFRLTCRAGGTVHCHDHVCHLFPLLLTADAVDLELLLRPMPAQANRAPWRIAASPRSTCCISPDFTFSMYSLK